MGKLPSWFRGRKILDDISGEEFFELDGQMTKQRGLNVSKKSYDKVTDKEREEAIKRRMR